MHWSHYESLINLSLLVLSALQPVKALNVAINLELWNPEPSIQMVNICLYLCRKMYHHWANTSLDSNKHLFYMLIKHGIANN